MAATSRARRGMTLVVDEATGEVYQRKQHVSVSTVYEALNRLTALRLISRNGAEYRVNPRFFFAQNPEVAQLVLEALQAPDVEPDERAHQPRRTSPIDARRRREVRSVS